MVKLKIKYNEEWNEYIVEYRDNGKLNEARSYYTDDKQDAEETLLVMKKDLGL